MSAIVPHLPELPSSVELGIGPGGLAVARVFGKAGKIGRASCRERVSRYV